MRALPAMILLLPLTAWAQTARETTLLSDDLTKNQRTRIDAPKDSFDSALDDALGGPQGFSTKTLEQIEERLKTEMRRDRPRATPRIILFLYPGRIDAERLKSLTEVNVDIELVMDPCDRNVCKEAVAKHIELVGRAVGQPVVRTANARILFQTLTLKTSTTMHGEEMSMYQVPISACVTASQRAGGGVAWLDAQEHADAAYEPIVLKAIARRAAERRVQLAGPPSVKRGAGNVDVTVKVRGDRARTEQQTIDALAAVEAGLRDNPKTPAQQGLEVDLELGPRDQPRRFRAPGSPVGLYLDRRLSGAELWSTYVGEVKKDKGAQTMSFDDAEGEAAAGTSGATADQRRPNGHAPAASGDGDAPDPDDNEAIAVLGSNFSSLGACVKTEAQKNPRFRGVTLTFQWTGHGQAANADAKEPAYKGSPLARCLRDALSAIRLPRHNAAPRTIEYPIRVR